MSGFQIGILRNGIGCGSDRAKGAANMGILDERSARIPVYHA